ncbi:MAG: electron transfer flavoprotein subunit alpha/FixB family protein [Bacteroidia bacterium]|nr:electron transfer flavoprotein subunit alpha/FixB family protein [Rikenellaceae bacterium]NCB19413.1 electron transfer flavoprotein subunit alpha/FixB family protein [Bacteroidia bacterium]
MNNIIVYIETEGGKIADVSLELLTKGRSLAGELSCKLEALLIGDSVESHTEELFRYGAEKVHLAQDKKLMFYQTLPYSAITIDLFRKEQPQIALFGATSVGRDLAPRVSSALMSGLTADCTSLEIGEHKEAKSGKEYKNLLYQIRPAFGGNIIATIINPEHRPQMATVREGVMKKEPLEKGAKGKISQIDVTKILKDGDFVVDIIERHIEERRVDIKGSAVIIAGGFGVGSKENFNLLYDLAAVLGGEVGASRAAVDAGFAEPARQIGQTGVTVRPKLYIAVGISGQIQHTAGMDQSAMIISINNDPLAPIHQIADYAIIGDLNEIIPRMIKSYKQNSK